MPLTREHAARTLGILALLLLGGCPKTLTDPGYMLTLAPPGATLFVEESTRFTATARDRDGNVVPMTFSWSSNNPAVATIDASGLVRAVGQGSALITATGTDLAASASILVNPDNGQTLTVEPAADSMFVDGTVRFTATLRDRNGDVVPGTPTWTSTDPGVATVDDTGLARGMTSGSTTVRAIVGELVAAAALTVRSRPSGTGVLVGAGDIASCASAFQDEATANLLDGISGTVFAAGDNAYPSGTAAQYNSCYHPTWGRQKGRTRPVPGNHEYFTGSAAGYFNYFGAAAGDPARGYYSYDVGAWHVVAVNSNAMMTAGSPQERWLRDDLAAYPTRCTIAIWHHPRFSSGPHGSTTGYQAMWQALYDAGAEIVISAHDHTYERFAPQTPSGDLDMARGIRQFVVGTGGAELYDFVSDAPHSEQRNNSTRGVLKLTLSADRYDWQFIPVAGGTFTDAGSASCH